MSLRASFKLSNKREMSSKGLSLLSIKSFSGTRLKNIECIEENFFKYNLK